MTPHEHDARPADDAADAHSAGARPADAALEAQDPAAFWEQRYASAENIWSGAVNGTLASVLEALPSGRVLDLGCGEGGDAIWLAQQGWDVTGADISPSAVRRARDAAAAAGLDESRIRFLAVDLSPWTRSAPGSAAPATASGPDAALAAPSGAPADAAVELDGDPALLEGPFDLVTASFFHSEQELERTLILRRAAGALAPGGRLVILSHAKPAPDSPHAHHGGPPLLDPAQEREELALPADQWEVEREEWAQRPAVEHRHGHHQDGLLVLRRRLAG